MSQGVEDVLAAAAELERLSRQRITWARRGEWDALVESEARRGELAERIRVDVFEGRDDLGRSLADRLTRIRDLDEELVPLLEQARDDLAVELQKVQKKAAGARAYDRTSRGEKG
ncbi:flagellar protein FliT [Ectothiorhodospira haloalkaliphila]|uniref:flagellar protein FliT n=1 Tax=Ectothiorhodospira haloalkaliphila TaxID=421628 RepID=UPI001EE8979C|nr:flagellar protein FliT [Ectothiorhodospira haloalkaliphila]MCG5524771.1 flagellar protein FliT [Ectothiorhodospira haloalkaliphila]